MKAFLCTVLTLCLCFNFCFAEFDENLAKKLVNFAAASFIAPDPQSTKGIDLANQCFTKSWPDGDWAKIKPYQYSITPCANKMSDECQLVIAVSESLKKVVIAFRGTVGKTQMDHESEGAFSDYQAWDVDASLGNVNKYFAGAAESSWSAVESALKSYKGYDFYFTGHSLGGAMASLSALRAVYKGYINDNQTYLYTFGEPRVGDINLANSFKTYITEKYRVIHNSDPVPHLPFCWGLLSDKCTEKNGKPYHQPQEIWYNNNDETMDNHIFKKCSAVDGEDKDCSNSLSGVEFGYNVASNRGFDMHLHYYDHRLDTYGPAGCNSAGSLGFSLLSLTFLFILNFFRH